MGLLLTSPPVQRFGLLSGPESLAEGMESISEHDVSTEEEKGADDDQIEWFGYFWYCIELSVVKFLLCVLHF